MRKYFAIFFFIFLNGYTFAQNKDTIANNDTIIAVFDPNNAHKDGYQIGGNTIVDLPYDVVQKCANKKIRIIGKQTQHDVTEEDLKYKNEDGETVYMQGRVGSYSTFVINNISVWNPKTKRWKKVLVTRK